MHLQIVLMFGYAYAAFGEAQRIWVLFACFIDVELIYNVVLMSAVQQSDPVIHIYVCMLFCILFHYGLSGDIEYGSVCCRVGPCLFIVYKILCYLLIENSLSSPPPFTSPLANKSVFSMFVSLSLLYMGSLVLYFRFHHK